MSEDKGDKVNNLHDQIYHSIERSRREKPWRVMAETRQVDAESRKMTTIKRTMNRMKTTIKIAEQTVEQ